MKLFLLCALTILLIIGAIVLWFGWSFSADISGPRQQSIQTSPQFQDGSFVNVERQAPFELTWDYLHEQFFGK
jgi:hypothetical protein